MRVLFLELGIVDEGSQVSLGELVGRRSAEVDELSHRSGVPKDGSLGETAELQIFGESALVGLGEEGTG